MKILPINLYQQYQNLVQQTNQSENGVNAVQTSNNTAYNYNYELNDMLPDWQYTQYSITGCSNSNSGLSKMVDDKIQEYYDQFKHKEMTYSEFIEKIQELDKKYPACVALNINGCTAEVKTEYSTLYAVDPTEEEISALWKKYKSDQIETVAFTKELEKFDSVSKVELDYSIPSLEQVKFEVNGKHYNISKSRTGFDFDKKRNMAHGPSVFQELNALGFSRAEVCKYFKKIEKVKAANNEYSYKMRDDIHIQGKIVSDLMELRDLVVIKRLQED
jgi:Holliday junction resolvasome RuvABC DNA-binding subunit